MTKPEQRIDLEPTAGDLALGLKLVSPDRLRRIADALAPPPPEPEDRDRLPAGSSAGGVASVLVVDDDEDIVRFITVNLESTKRFTVTTAEDGQAALDRIADATFDLILTGVMMPRMDGMSLVRRLRARPDTARTPIIICTARSSMRDVVSGLAIGADDYVVKPFDPRDLTARIAAAIRRGREAAAEDRSEG